jgi:hypothetical protein
MAALASSPNGPRAHGVAVRSRSRRGKSEASLENARSADQAISALLAIDLPVAVWSDSRA